MKNTGEEAPYIHNLNRLADIAKINRDQAAKELLAIVTSFNMTSRYPSEKLSFYKKADKEFAGEWMQKIKPLIVWVKKQFPKE